MFPPDFSEEELALAVAVGKEAVYHARKSHGASHGDLSAAVKEAFEHHVKQENDLLRARLALQPNDELKRDLEQIRADLAAKRLDAQEAQKLAAAEAERLRAEHRRLATELKQEQARAGRLSEELAQSKISVCKGELGEVAVADAMQGAGLYCVRVGDNGVHHGKYQDLLCSSSPLIRATTAPGAPLYACDDEGHQRLSVEVKCHNSSNKMTAEVEKFAERRALMLREGRADCFLFAATASIPGQASRTKVQIHRADAGYVVSALLGASDLKSEEICIAARMVLATQSRLRQVRRAPLQDGDSEALRVWGEELIGRTRAQVHSADEQLRLAEQMAAQAKAARLISVVTLVRHLDVLLKTGMLEVDAQTQDVADALAIVVDEDAKKPANDKILRFNTELKQLREAIPPTSKRARSADD